MVQHVLKSDSALREFEHIQVNSPWLAYLFFYDRQGHHSLMKEAAFAICSPPSSPEHPGEADSDDYSIASESGGGHRHQRHWQAERRLAPVRLNLPIFHFTDANAYVTYEIWHFDVK